MRESGLAATKEGHGAEEQAGKEAKSWFRRGSDDVDGERVGVGAGAPRGGVGAGGHAHTGECLICPGGSSVDLGAGYVTDRDDKVGTAKATQAQRRAGFRCREGGIPGAERDVSGREVVFVRDTVPDGKDPPTRAYERTDPYVSEEQAEIRQIGCAASNSDNVGSGFGEGDDDRGAADGWRGGDQSQTDESATEREFIGHGQGVPCRETGSVRVQN